MLCFSVTFDWSAATPLGHPGPRWPDHPTSPSKAAVEVRERTKLSLWHWPAAHTQKAEERCVGRRWNHNGESRKHDPGVSSSTLEGTELEGSTVQGWSTCGSSQLWPTPAVAPGFPAQLSSASVARHCHLFVKGNTVIWSFSIKMWVVAWDTSNDANIHTLLHSLWTGMCNLGAIYKHSLARHPHFCDP